MKAQMHEIVERTITCPKCQTIISDNDPYGCCVDYPLDDDMCVGDKFNCPECKVSITVTY